MPPWTVQCLSILTLLGSCLPGLAQAKYAHGARRSGKKLVGPPVIEEQNVNSPLQCLFLCADETNCKALNFNTVNTGVNCQLFEERACLSNELVADPDVDYYDVYDQPTTERQMSVWGNDSCVKAGYCSLDCSPEEVEEVCADDCSYPSMAPPGAFHCSNGTCQTTEGFWEVRPGFALPRMTNATLYPWVQAYKQLKDGICSLDIALKLGVGAKVDLKLVGTQRETQTRLKFRISIATTDLLFYKEELHTRDDIYSFDEEGTEIPIVSGADTTEMVNTETFTRLKISWCDGNMAIGPEDNPTLVSGQADEVGEIVYLAGTSSGPESYLQVDASVADSWLFDEEGTDPDPIFSFGDTMITKRIEPSVDVTVKYDCMAEYYCNVFFRSAHPHMLTVYVGGWINSDTCGIAYNDSTWGPYLLEHVTGPVLSPTEFNTFTVRYNNGKITVFRNDDAEPIYNVTVPTLLPPITSVGIGSMFWGGWKSVRVARYDPAWRTDTWKTDGTGFSNVDWELHSP